MLKQTKNAIITFKDGYSIGITLTKNPTFQNDVAFFDKVNGKTEKINLDNVCKVEINKCRIY